MKPFGVPDSHDRPIANQRGRAAEGTAPIRYSGYSPSRQVIAQLELRRGLAQLVKARNAAEEAACTKSQFLAYMSHEIRTPMNVVMGLAGLLLDTHLRPQQREFAETIRSSADSLLRIINNILDFSKIETGKLLFANHDFDMVEAVENTLEMLSVSAQAKGIELTCTVVPGTPTHLSGDAGRLGQILANLVANAIKFTEEGEIAVRIFKERETDLSAVLRFEVQDTGKDFWSESPNHLFAPFSRVDGTLARKYVGPGLGLAIAKQLASMMHGEIGVESRAGEGSTFWFTAEFAKQKRLSVNSFPTFAVSSL